MGSFGTKQSGTHSSCIFIGPYWQGFDAGHVLHDGKGSEAGAVGAGALEINGVNRA